MPALSFNKQFIPQILTGIKTQTIRAFRKHPIKSGDHLYLYTGMRTKQCEKIGEADCIAVAKVTIKHDKITIVELGENWTLSTNKQLNEFAVNDGFKDWQHMRLWWSLTHGTNGKGNMKRFKGQIIYWENFVPA